MSSFVDLTGQNFGRWSVVSYWGKKKEKTYWNVICSCFDKTEKIITGASLKSGLSKSCGCLHLEMLKDNLINISGNTYGRLTVVNFKEIKNKQTYWNCICECGNYVFTDGNSLKRGLVKSCGCYRKDFLSKLKMVDITGNKYGMLFVVGFRERINRTTYWECLCDCGNMTIADGSSLKKGHTKSCGCLSESYIASELKKYCDAYYNSVSEYNECVNPETGHFLPYDIYFETLYNKIYIEVQGKQHYEFIPIWHETVEGFEYSQHKDKIKKDYAKSKGIYIEIDLRKIKTIEDAIIHIESFI